MFGKKARRIRELEEQVAALNASLETGKQENAALTEKVQRFEERERSIVRALTEAAERAEVVVSDAQRQAGEILEQSQADSEAAQREAERIVDDAYGSAHKIVKDAESESTRRLDETQAQIETYVSILTGYDKLIQDNIRMAEENAHRFAEVGQRLHAAIPQILSADGKLIEAPAAPEDGEPEAESKGERLWTVSELCKIDAPEASVDAIIDGVIASNAE